MRRKNAVGKIAKHEAVPLVLGSLLSLYRQEQQQQKLDLMTALETRTDINYFLTGSSTIIMSTVANTNPIVTAARKVIKYMTYMGGRQLQHHKNDSS